METLVKSQTLLIFSALRPKTLEENRHEALQKLRNSALSMVLVDDMLLICLDLVRLSRFQVGWSKILGYPYSLQKNFSAVLYESQELLWRQVGVQTRGFKPPKPPVASPLDVDLFLDKSAMCLLQAITDTMVQEYRDCIVASYDNTSRWRDCQLISIWNSCNCSGSCHYAWIRWAHDNSLRNFSCGIMGVNHGGTNPPRICSGGTLIQVVPPDFCHFSKFQALAMDSSLPRFQPRSTPLCGIIVADTKLRKTDVESDDTPCCICLKKFYAEPYLDFVQCTKCCARYCEPYAPTDITECYNRHVCRRPKYQRWLVSFVWMFCMTCKCMFCFIAHLPSWQKLRVHFLMYRFVS
jgi:hypothetical protein